MASLPGLTSKPLHLQECEGYHKQILTIFSGPKNTHLVMTVRASTHHLGRHVLYSATKGVCTVLCVMGEEVFTQPKVCQHYVTL